jgi:hypothetical protein
LLDTLAVKYLIGGLIGAGGSVAGGVGGSGSVAAVGDEFIDEPLLAVGQLGLASERIGFAFGHLGHSSSKFQAGGETGGKLAVCATVRPEPRKFLAKRLWLG